jgi:hypothetical protein
MTKRIGVLMVHGIGTNPPNQFLVQETRKIVAAMSEQAEAITVLAEPPVAKEVPEKYVIDYGKNIVRVLVKLKDAPEDLMIEFNEVYWADLGEKPTLFNQIAFWFWALSMWSVAARDWTPLEGQKDVYIPKHGTIKAWERPLLAIYGVLFMLGASTVGLYNVIADRLKLPRIPISDILTAYLGDVMLYSQASGTDDPEVGDFALPPRVGIRARMVDALAEFAMRDYDCWYLFSHSQGTVIAYNGIMETGVALPNYLTLNRWNTVRSSYLGLVKPAQEAAPQRMMPRRPVWLGETDSIDRHRLFAKLQGFLTYGSAIGKFRGIWPVIVPANNEEYVFRNGFDWVNVYDWTDPVSGPLDAFTRLKGCNAKGQKIKNAKPICDKDGEQIPGADSNTAGFVSAKIDFNISYKSGSAWLLSHLQYLNYYSRAYRRPDPLLVCEVAKWLVGEPPQWKQLIKTRPFSPLRRAMTGLEVLIAIAAVWLSTAGLLWWLASGNKYLWWLEPALWPIVAGVAVAVAFIAEGLGMVWRLVAPKVAAVRPVRIISIALAVGAIGWLSCFIMRQSWYKDFETWFGDAAKLFHHQGASRMAVGLMSLTLIILVVLGGLRWLTQPIPVKQSIPAKK